MEDLAVTSRSAPGGGASAAPLGERRPLGREAATLSYAHDNCTRKFARIAAIDTISKLEKKFFFLCASAWQKS